MNRNAFTQADLDKAVALFYDGNQAPYVSAKGTGAVAQEIIAIAEAEGVPLCDNRDLVDLLVTLELGDEIPEALYRAVALSQAWPSHFPGQPELDDPQGV